MGRLIGDNLGFFGGLFSLIAGIAVLIFLFLWLVLRFFDLMIDIMASRVLQGRRIYVDGEEGYKMMRIANTLARYLTDRGAIITGEESSAEFRVILRPDIMDSSALSCTIIDTAGHQETSKVTPFHWLRLTAIKVCTFIRNREKKSRVRS